MAERKLPPVPPPPPQGGVPEDYNTIAETVGLVPSLRKQDNIIQAKAVGAGCLVGAVGGLIVAAATHSSLYIGAMAGLLVGMVAAALISGFVLMILGLARATKRRRTP